MQLTYLEAIRQGIWEEMDRDPSVFCLGEDIGIYGGAFKVTDGFIDRFGPERVIDTPIAESAIVGAAFGASLTGMRPVAEFQFMDFIGCAFNQISNMVAKTHYLWGAPAPLVLRGPSGGYVHGGPFHSQNPEMWFVHNPGLKVICPATPYDAKGLIKAAIRDNNPCIFFEHKYLYRRIKGEVPADDYVVPIGKANIAREGRDISVITYAAMVHSALEAGEVLSKEGIELEVLDLRTVSPLDREAITQTVKKTNKVIILHEHSRTGGLAGEIAAQDDHVRLVHLGRGQELTEADLGPVDVGGEVDAQLALLGALGLTSQHPSTPGEALAWPSSGQGRCAACAPNGRSGR